MRADRGRCAHPIEIGRGGTGYSDPVPLPRTAEAVATELHELLHAQKHRRPYVLVRRTASAAPTRIGSRCGTRWIQVSFAERGHEVERSCQRSCQGRGRGVAGRVPIVVA